MKYVLLIVWLVGSVATAQVPVDLSKYTRNSRTAVVQRADSLLVSWPGTAGQTARLVLSLVGDEPLLRRLQLAKGKTFADVATNLDPAFVLTIGKRDLVSQNGWNIFFDKTNRLPSKAYAVTLTKRNAQVSTVGTRTIVRIGDVVADRFSGALEITVYEGSSLVNIAAVMSTQVDSTAILYDAGLVSKQPGWNTLAWADTSDQLHQQPINLTAPNKAQAVKYRAIMGSGANGTLAVFPAPHQYFYPLDEAYNLDFTWYGTGYRKLIPGFGIGIRQDLMGDRRWVPWVNAPPGTQQRLNFFCFLSLASPAAALTEVKRFTHADKYPVLPGYKTLSSHFHNEHVMNTVLAGKPVPKVPNFVKVFKRSGVNIVHLAEFHGPGHPKGPDSLRLLELKTLFSECERLSDREFLLLPGEEPNNFFGGHWLDFFPRNVYWIMSRKPGMPFVTDDPVYGKVYRIADKNDMLRLLEAENGLAWTAHARTKGSTGYPDAYKNEAFYTSDHFFGAAWKNIPADLSLPRLSPRVLDLMDDMANWGLKKHVIAESDIFSMEPANETYAHLNVNYLQLDRLPDYKQGWQPVLDVMQQGRFFVTTGEVLLPTFSVGGKGAGETLTLPADGNIPVTLTADWTFPLTFAEIISGDGRQVYRQRIDLTQTRPFGRQQFRWNANLTGRAWVRVEVWDAAANGAFTQQIWLQKL